MRYWIFFLPLFFFFGCAKSDYSALVNVALSQDPANAAKSLARNKGAHYASNPGQLTKDLKNLDINIRDLFAALIGEVSKEWGKENVEESKKSKTVKYIQDFKSRVLVDFDAGVVTVETILNEKIEQHLKEAIVMALLMPDDPSQVDLFDSSSVKLGETPFLYEEILDDQNKPIRWEWRANRYADILLKNSLKSRMITRKNRSLKVSYVNIPMVKTHEAVRENKFAPLVKTYAKRYNLSQALVYAIIQTESNFNQYAISKSGAVGLMQIMKATAGKDAYRELTGKDWEPTRDYLYNAKNNIEMGTTYLHILRHRYLAGISHPLSSEYCIISGYNGGAGTVLKAFHSNRKKAKSRINSMTPTQVYRVLRTDVAYAETRNYIKKVVDNKRNFIGLN